MSKESILHKGDIVYHWKHGKGYITELIDFRSRVAFPSDSGDMLNTTLTNEELSFTPYTLKNGGWSQERPLTVGEVIYVWEGSEPKAVESGRYHSTLFGTFGITKNDGGVAYFSRWSRENPLLTPQDKVIDPKIHVGDRVRSGCGDQSKPWIVEEIRKEDGWVWGKDCPNAYFGGGEKNLHNPDFLTKIS